VQWRQTAETDGRWRQAGAVGAAVTRAWMDIWTCMDMDVLPAPASSPPVLRSALDHHANKSPSTSFQDAAASPTSISVHDVTSNQHADNSPSNNVFKGIIEKVSIDEMVKHAEQTAFQAKISHEEKDKEIKPQNSLITQTEESNKQRKKEKQSSNRIKELHALEQEGAQNNSADTHNAANIHHLPPISAHNKHSKPLPADTIKSTKLPPISQTSKRLKAGLDRSHEAEDILEPTNNNANIPTMPHSSPMENTSNSNLKFKKKHRPLYQRIIARAQKRLIEEEKARVSKQFCI
jgi:hypothetical protein